MGLYSFIQGILALMSFIGILTYMVPYLIHMFLPEQDLKKRYGAKWALVTGASSGIGKSIVIKCAEQGISVVLVALPDKLLDQTFEEVKKTYPSLKFIKCGVNLGTPGYLPTIIEAAKDVPISLLFNNAGYILTGFYHEQALERSLQNIECNAICGAKLTHHFTNRMMAEGLKGLVCFTSSPAGKMPNPTSALYGSTKAFVTEFGASIAGELRPHGIDVLVIHPSPISSRFYDDAHKLSAIKLFRKTETTPAALVDVMFRSAGRTVIRDQGYFPIMLNFLKILDFNLLTWITAIMASRTGDFEVAKQKKNK